MIESSPVLSLTKVKRQKEVKWRDQILRTSNRVGVWDPGKSLQWPIKTWVMVFPFNWPGVLQAMGSHRDGHDWATELKWTELNTPRLLKWLQVGHNNGSPLSLQGNRGGPREARTLSQSLLAIRCLISLPQDSVQIIPCSEHDDVRRSWKHCHMEWLSNIWVLFYHFPDSSLAIRVFSDILMC